MPIIHDLGVTATRLCIGSIANGSTPRCVSASRWFRRRRLEHPAADMAIVTVRSSTVGSTTVAFRAFASLRRRLALAGRG